MITVQQLIDAAQSSILNTPFLPRMNDAIMAEVSGWQIIGRADVPHGFMIVPPDWDGGTEWLEVIIPVLLVAPALLLPHYNAEAGEGEG